MKKLLLFLLPIFLLMSCKKEELEGDYLILQGKWKWIGSTETVEDKVNETETISWIPASDYSTEYFMEFEQEGVLSYWENERETKFYRIEMVNSNNECNNFSNCQYLGINLNFKTGEFIRFFMNEDSMEVVTKFSHVPLISYENILESVGYVHTFARIN